MKQRIAMFKSLGACSFTSPWSLYPDADDTYCPSGYVRISGWVDVDFPERSAEERVPEEIAQLDAQAEEVKREFAAKLRAIAEAKGTLLALTQEVPHG